MQIGKDEGKVRLPAFAFDRDRAELHGDKCRPVDLRPRAPAAAAALERGRG
jgi:hypothetical protein